MKYLRAIFTLLRFVWGDILYRYREDRIWRDYRREMDISDHETMREIIARRESRLEKLRRGER